jgi:hypothetical protein
MASDGDGSRFRRMMELPVTASGSSDMPAILLKTLDNVANFHTDHHRLPF